MEDPYNYFPAVTFGGPSGDYSIIAPVTSCRWAEYCVVSAANGDGGTGAAVISGDNKPAALVYDGSKTLNTDTYFTGQALRLPQTSTVFPQEIWQRITDSQKKVFARIDAAAASSFYITVKFRVMPITVVPGPALTVHPDHSHQMNIAREEMATERLKAMNVPMTSYTRDAQGRRVYAEQDMGDKANGKAGK